MAHSSLFGFILTDLLRNLIAMSTRIGPGIGQILSTERRIVTQKVSLARAKLLDEPSPPGSIYQRWKTYRCSILVGEARPGSEPEAVYADAYSFTEVGWFDLRHPTTWNERLEADSFIYAWLQRIQEALGYRVASALQTYTEERR